MPWLMCGGQKTTWVGAGSFLQPGGSWWLNLGHHKWPQARYLPSPLTGPWRDLSILGSFPCRIKHPVKPVVTESVKWTCCLCVVMTMSVKDKAAIQQYVANKETCTVKEISTRYGRPDRDIGGQLWGAFYLCDKKKDPRHLSCTREVQVSSCQSELGCFKR